VVDVNLLEVPDPRGISPATAQRLADALERMSQREVGRLVEEQLMDCHTPDRARRIAAGPLVLSDELQQRDRRDLDDAVFELLGVSDPKERDELIGRLYEATAQHFREIRVVEIEKMQQRAKSNSQRFSVHDLAADIWDAAEIEDATPWRSGWSISRVQHAGGHPGRPSGGVVTFAHVRPDTVYFGKSRKSISIVQCHAQAELIAHSQSGRKRQREAARRNSPVFQAADRVNVRMDKALARFRELAESRTSDERVREQLAEVCRGGLSWGVRQPSPRP
jgi:hypothetical protein